MARPTKFTTARKHRILAILGAGGSRREAARAAGIDASTLRGWIRRGERSTPEGVYGRFLADIKAAESGQRLVGLEPDHNPELDWALRIAEREWAMAGAEERERAREPAPVIELTWDDDEDEDED